MTSFNAKPNARGAKEAAIADEGAAVSVRGAEPEEHEAIRVLLEAAYRQFASAIPQAIYEPYIADILDLEPRVRAGSLLVAEQAGRLLGTVTFYEQSNAQGVGWPPGWAGVRALGVDTAARGRGIGRLLMEACLDRARRAGAAVLGLHTAEIMTAAVALYEHMGFRRAPTFDFDAPASHRVEGERPITVIAYRLDL